MTSIGIASIKRTMSTGIASIKMLQYGHWVLWICFPDGSIIVWEEVAVKWV
jgi:hypothetical protein